MITLRLPKVTGYGGRYDRLVEDDALSLVEWQPGDGTRYLIAAAPLGIIQGRMLGAGPGAALVSLSTDGERWTTVVVNPGVLHHIGNLEEKVRGLTAYTLTAYAALLNLTMGNEQYGLELAASLGLEHLRHPIEVPR
jgi:hypothetical protein